MKITSQEEQILQQALVIAEKRMTYSGDLLQTPEGVRNFLRIWGATNPDREVFGVIWMTAKHEVICVEELFTGSIDSASVYPRQVIAAALANDAAAAIIFHNHPSGNPEPSDADIVLTRKLKEGLAMVDVRLLDSMIAGSTITSLAELGRM